MRVPRALGIIVDQIPCAMTEGVEAKTLARRDAATEADWSGVASPSVGLPVADPGDGVPPATTPGPPDEPEAGFFSDGDGEGSRSPLGPVERSVRSVGWASGAATGEVSSCESPPADDEGLASFAESGASTSFLGGAVPEWEREELPP